MVLGNVTCGRDLDGGSECASECASECVSECVSESKGAWESGLWLGIEK